jgi:type IV pilus assembly protein PilN
MIRVNLLSVDRARSERRSSFQVGQKVTVGCSLLLVGTALLIGWWYWTLTEASGKVNSEVDAAQAEAARLRTVMQQVTQFEQRKGQLQDRVALIERLRKGQGGPVHMLDEVSRALPEGLWLTELKQQGAEVDISGRCAALTTLSDFVANLEASQYFKKPVEILNSQTEKSDQAQGELVNFSIKAQFGLPGS